MKHSNLEPIRLALIQQERDEFKDALGQHGDVYYFIDQQAILRQYSDEDISDLDCPVISVTVGSNFPKSHQLIVHYADYNRSDGMVRVYGRELVTLKRTYSAEWEVRPGELHVLMDYMKEPISK